MTKTATLLLKLDDGWCDVPSLCQEFGWKPHSLRAAISTLKLGDNWHIERRRENGVTSYRVAPMLADDGQPTETQEWQDYARDC